MKDRRKAPRRANKRGSWGKGKRQRAEKDRQKDSRELEKRDNQAARKYRGEPTNK